MWAGFLGEVLQGFCWLSTQGAPTDACPLLPSLSQHWGRQKDEVGRKWAWQSTPPECETWLNPFYCIKAI